PNYSRQRTRRSGKHQEGGVSATLTVKYDTRRYKRRNRIEIMFGRLKDWRRVATRYNRCPKVFLSTIALTASIIYCL
ncbi:transposase, partial [uncultured Tateyamaria sp.]|uniref:transposase n=1 Tax=uncultured Tateyamaria sp. TaxID=455651 RepID=UPI00260E2524